MALAGWLGETALSRGRWSWLPEAGREPVPTGAPPTLSSAATSLLPPPPCSISLSVSAGDLYLTISLPFTSLRGFPVLLRSADPHPHLLLLHVLCSRHTRLFCPHSASGPWHVLGVCACGTPPPFLPGKAAAHSSASVSECHSLHKASLTPDVVHGHSVLLHS